VAGDLDLCGANVENGRTTGFDLMRLLNALAAMSGAFSIAMLAAAAHAAAASPALAANAQTGGFIQLAIAAAVLAMANRAGRLNLIAGAVLLAGATLFAGAQYAALFGLPTTGTMIAPVGGVLMIGGWLILAFAKPRD